MLELGEIKNIERQINNTLIGKRIRKVYLPTIYQRFAWFYGDVNLYPQLLEDRTIYKAKGHGLYIDLYLGELTLTAGEGTHIRYYEPGAKPPFKFQLGLEFTDTSRLFFTIPISGGIWVFTKNFTNINYTKSLGRDILDHDFDLDFLLYLINDAKQDITIKQLIVNEQVFPGIGFPATQDILFLAKISPKRTLKSLTLEEKTKLYYTIKEYFDIVIPKRGKVSEKDLFGAPGDYEGYFQCAKTRKECCACGSQLAKEHFTDATMYYCPNCQK